jgi:hypothetical protein
MGAGTPSMFRTPHLASMKTEEKFMFLIYELFLGLSRGEETFDSCDKSPVHRAGMRKTPVLMRFLSRPF